MIIFLPTICVSHKSNKRINKTHNETTIGLEKNPNTCKTASLSDKITTYAITTTFRKIPLHMQKIYAPVQSNYKNTLLIIKQIQKVTSLVPITPTIKLQKYTSNNQMHNQMQHIPQLNFICYLIKINIISH